MQEACAISIRRPSMATTSEHIFGQALRRLDRDSLVLSSKVGRRMPPKADNDDVPGWRKGGLAFKNDLRLQPGGARSIGSI
jgi:aryl-alcohol dehydrogenase-like predicted oxidoreductase